jgi:hypothetical protein
LNIGNPLMKFERLMSAIALSILQACGGGSDVDGKLAVLASYPSSDLSVTEKSTVGFSISGLEGNKATCEFDSILNSRFENVYSPTTGALTGVNTIGTVPNGFSINKDTCAITVDSTTPGTYSVKVGVNIPGYYSAQGGGGLSSLVVPFSVKVNGPQLVSSMPQQTFTWADQVSINLAPTLQLSGIPLLPTDTLEYVGSIAGIAISTQGLATGQIKAASAQSGSVSVKITRGGRVFFSSPVYPVVNVITPALSIPNQVVTSSAPLLPVLSGIQASDALTFSAGLSYKQPCAKPTYTTADSTYFSPIDFSSTHPFSVDQNTGAIRSNGKVGKFCVPLAVRTNRKGLSEVFETFSIVEFR